ncbi:MAG: orotate phosphoribosyltransferase [Nitrosotalea sp.]
MELVDSKQKDKELQEKENLRQLIVSTEAFKYYKEKIKLAYGEPSHFYFDFRRLTGHPKGANSVGTVLYNEIIKLGDVGSVGGLESGAITVATAISIISSLNNQNNQIHSFYVRKKPKENGLSKWVEGRIIKPVVIVDDVITTGTSALKAVEKVREEGHKVEHIIAIVFRGTAEDKEKIESNNVKLHYIFEGSEFTKKYEKEHPEVLTH